MTIPIGVSVLLAATIAMIAWFRRVSPQVPIQRREWTPVDAPPPGFAQFLSQLCDELDEQVGDAFLVRCIEQGLTIHQATRLRLLESKKGGDPVSIGADSATETAAEPALKTAKPDKDSPKRRPSR